MVFIPASGQSSSDGCHDVTADERADDTNEDRADVTSVGSATSSGEEEASMVDSCYDEVMDLVT